MITSFSQHLGIRPFLWVAPAAPLLCQHPGVDHPEVSFPRVSEGPCARDCGAQRLRDRPTRSASSGCSQTTITGRDPMTRQVEAPCASLEGKPSHAASLPEQLESVPPGARAGGCGCDTQTDGCGCDMPSLRPDSPRVPSAAMKQHGERGSTWGLDSSLRFGWGSPLLVGQFREADSVGKEGMRRKMKERSRSRPRPVSRAGQGCKCVVTTCHPHPV
ncbi:PREDICTED: prokineticin-1 isoform X1 [Myotis brandtii]|uniref:prokineticin-1 isoform X1 n=1 Tax=Myotis brandtii TaxID=109478 RepID=UPI0007040A7E|nr:PREDICTED: prokineticin-1 isoform X1 [Myotis brandtii]